MPKLEELARQLLDKQRPELQRAVDLFEVQTAIFCNTGKLRRQARRFAAIKLMEQIERENNVTVGDLQSAFLLDGYKELFAEALSGGGWLSLRRLPSDRTFANRLNSHIAEARVASNVIEFLCSWKVAPPNKRPSISKALYVVRRQGKTLAKEKWGRYAKWSIPIHLLLEKKYDFLPPKLTTKRFSEKLLEQVRKPDELRLFFGAYNSVLQALPELEGDKIPTQIWLKNVELPPVTVHYDKLSDEIKNKLDQYKSGED
jgi:hypothetical protein